MRSRRSVWIGFVVMILMATAPLAVAQEGGRRGGQERGGRARPEGAARGFAMQPRGMMGGMGGMDKISLAGIEQVQKELAITEEQKTKIGEVTTAYREQLRSTLSMEGWRDLSQEERQERMQEAAKKREAVAAEFEKKLAAVLKPEQMTRLSEISVQQRGVQGLKDKETVKALKITEEQIKKIDEALEWGVAEQRKMFEEMRSGATEGERPTREQMEARRAEMTAKREKITKEIEAKVMAALTDEQKEKYTKMKGKKFELDTQALMRGRMGGRQGGPGGAEGGAQRPERPQRPGAGQGRRGAGEGGAGEGQGRQRPQEL